MGTSELLAALLFVALLVFAAVAGTRSAGVPGKVAVGATGRDASRPPSPPPAVEPLVVADIAPEDARGINARVGFVTGPNPPARPFRFPGGAIERERALACLAAAVLYEAGDDAVGQGAVAQVVLNRVRHPAFPKSVCGVVFQGSERATGCQFTFTCDGALSRSYSAPAWQRARQVAARALSGGVFARVGTATHYHTDWVVPYWSASLDKLAAVDTHLFFRWRGWWGTPAAFRGGYAGPERVDRRIVYLLPAEARPSDAEVLPGPEDEPRAVEVQGISPQLLGRNQLRVADTAKNQFVVLLDTAEPSGAYAGLALAMCRGRSPCTVFGWVKPGLVPARLPLPPGSRAALSFYYHRPAGSIRDQALWHCRQFRRPDPAQCLPGTGPAPAAATTTAARPSAEPAPRAPAAPPPGNALPGGEASRPTS